MDTQTRLVIPAPRETREESEILWYEVRITETAEEQEIYWERGQRRTLAAAQFTVDEATVRTVFSEPGTEQLTMTASVERDASSRVRISAEINGGRHEIVGLGDGSEVEPPSQRPRLDADALRTIAHWGRIGEPLQTLAHATRESWGCVSCAMVLCGTALLTGCCFTGNLACCGGALVAGGEFVGNCQGECAASQTAVVEAATYVEG